MNPTTNESPYQVLGITREASEAEIKRAYFSLVREHPPERDPEGFKRVRAAYEKLRTVNQRAETDLFLVEDQPLTLDVSSVQQTDAEPLGITPEMIRDDLLALEAFFLLEELASKQLESSELPD
jgi:curved DNA-binding protein CbpA